MMNAYFLDKGLNKSNITLIGGGYSISQDSDVANTFLNNGVRPLKTNVPIEWLNDVQGINNHLQVPIVC